MQIRFCSMYTFQWAEHRFYADEELKYRQVSGFSFQISEKLLTNSIFIKTCLCLWDTNIEWLDDGKWFLPKCKITFINQIGSAFIATIHVRALVSEWSKV